MASDIPAQSDPFEGLDSLEETYYHEGHSLGVADGARQGRAEGRVFGLEKGFEKFLEMGKLRGRSEVLAARLSAPNSGAEAGGGGNGVQEGLALEGGRLRRHVERLAALTDPGAFSTENEEQEVEAFEQRVRDARGKVRVVERILGEGEERVGGAADGVEGQARTRREGARVVQRRENGAEDGGGKAGEMEDFGSGKLRK